MIYPPGSDITESGEDGSAAAAGIAMLAAEITRNDSKTVVSMIRDLCKLTVRRGPLNNNPSKGKETPYYTYNHIKY